MHKNYQDYITNYIWIEFFEGNEEEMSAANNAVGYYESMDSISCPEYPGF